MQATLYNWTLNAISPQKNGFTPPMDMRDTIANIRALPPLPGSAMRIINLISDPKADVDKLAEIIETDPLLAAQIMRWSTSALYGYRGKITSVRDAIVRVLGFNFVMDLALGLAVLSPLRAPKRGSIGTRMFWIHALASTHLMKKLAAKLPPELQQNQNEVFLAGLLHNIGFPLLGHQFPNEFDYLDKLILANPNLSVYNLETFAFGVNHTQMGAWLMTAWSMPKLIIDVVYHHHNPFYRGDHYQLVLLTYISDYLLTRLGIGDAANQTCPPEVWTALSLSADEAYEMVAEIQDDVATYTELADTLTQ